ncbi:hypothetical protein G9A89_012956 [Geosiphon pyriformis]|nr:hypothetical protein G9A89_012956 [Geosiphon pyriformis]
MNTPKDMIVTTVFEFGKIKSIKIQLIGIWQKTVVEFAELDQADLLALKWSFLIGKNSVCVAKTVGDYEIWVSRNQFRAFLFTLLVGTIAHNLGHLLEKAGEKICFINCLLETGNKICCAVVCFNSDKALKFAYCTEPIFNGIKLSWTRLDLVHCENCEHFGHSTLKCDIATTPNTMHQKFIKRVAFEVHHFQLAKLYAKKYVPIFCPAAFGGKSWAQVVLLDFFFLGGSHSNFSFKSGFSPGGTLHGKRYILVGNDDSSINDHLALLEHSLELLADQVSDILCRLDGIELVPLVSVSKVGSPVVSASVVLMSDADMVLDILLSLFPFPSSDVVYSTVNLSLSSSKVLTFKVGGLESKIVALENKLLVTILGFYAGVSTSMHFGQAADINSMVSKAVNSSFFVILSGDFNENESKRSEGFSATLLASLDKFEVAQNVSDLNLMWSLLEGAIVQTATKMFSKSWYSVYNCSKNKQLSKFHKLKLLIVKIVRCWNSGNLLNFDYFVKVWMSIDGIEASKIVGMVLDSVGLSNLVKHLLVVKRKYQKFKYFESKLAEDAKIRKTINWCCYS